MPFTPFSPPLQKVATTGIAGFAKVNGTPTILSWTAPNDGAAHSFMVFSSETVAALETGGGIGFTFTAPGGGVQVGGTNIFAGGKAAGTYHQTDGAVVGPGTTVTVVQSAALTGGASTVWVELWAA